MKVVVAHNFYQQPGGEDGVFADECGLLERHGDAVVCHTVHNDSVAGTNAATLAVRTVWNRSAARDLHDLVRRERADVVHFHNTFPLLSPAAYSAARSAGAAVVQTLHNYRLICPGALLYRDGHVCHDCVGKPVPYPAVVHHCYRGSRGATAAVAAMLTINGVRGTYRRDVDAYIALTNFARDQFVASGGFPADRLHVKPNFVAPDPGVGPGAGGYALFVGRVTESKGVRVMLDAWRRLDAPVPLKVAGDGDLAGLVRTAAESDRRVEFLGRRSGVEIRQLMADAAALVFPSVWYEGLPKTILEAFAASTPVIASRLGSMAELVADGVTGALFAPGDAGDLSATVGRLFGGDDLRSLRPAARAAFDASYTADANYQRLTAVYDDAIRVRHSIAGQNGPAATAPAHPRRVHRGPNGGHGGDAVADGRAAQLTRPE